jgi:hypothetical protein
MEMINTQDNATNEALTAVDWNFPERIAHSDIEGIHPYPAKFITEIPRALLAAIPLPNGAGVLDPFCGSGTTLVECQRLGIPSVGIDLNPIACLISRVKTAPIPNDLESIAQLILEEAKVRPPTPIPSIPNLDHWFEQAVQEKLAGISSAISFASPPVRDCLQLALSSIIVRVSNQESDTRYAAIKKDIDPESVPTLFMRAVGRIATALSSRSYPLISADIIEGDTLKVLPKQLPRPVGLVITSPPYPNAYEYWLYHKYRMWWLGFDPLSVKEQEIGARAHFFKKNHHTAEDFVRQMRQTFNLLEGVVVSGGFACFVVGRSRIHGEIIDNARIIEEAGKDAGFHKFFVTERVMSASRKSFNLSHANIKIETVLVMKKGNK